MFDRRMWRSLVGLIVVFALGPRLSSAADPPPRTSEDENTSRTSHTDPADVEADDELLEFLGSVDAEEDAELVDYLVKTDAGAPSNRLAHPPVREQKTLRAQLRRRRTEKMNSLRLIVLASLLLAAAPTFAQTNPPSDAPAAAAPEANGVPWSNLSAEQRKVLQRYEGRWDSLPPQRQQNLSRGSQRWLQMTPNQRKDARGRFDKWKDLPPDRRREVRDRWQKFRELPPDEQATVRQNFRKFKNLPPEKRKALRERWQNATPAERQNMLDRTREQRERNFNRRSR